MQRLCIVCGSATASRPAYADATREPGSGLARRGVGFVYDGGSIGLMQRRANAAVAPATVAIGVIPRSPYSADMWLMCEEA